MARIKARPRVALPSPGPEEAPPPSQVTTDASAENSSSGSQVSNGKGNQSSPRTVRSKASTALPTFKSEKHSATESHATAEDFAVPGQRPIIKAISNDTDLTCPQCGAQFPEIGIKEFREHVESCTRPINSYSESNASSLSPPPESQDGGDVADGDTPDDDELANLRPYDFGSMALYPESKADSAVDEVNDGSDPKQKYELPKLTDIDKFVASFDNFEEVPYDVLYQRCLNAQQALVGWQNEWMDLDHYIKVTEPAAPGKEHKNPRMPKTHLTGVGYQDQLEAFAYGYEYSYHHAQVGNQNPLKQRITNGANSGRELRQRVPTQKAVEADLSTDSDDGHGGRRRGRAHKSREEPLDPDLSGQASRGRNVSRFDSESRGQTPQKTFASGKTVGRPRTKVNNKTLGGSRLKEVQVEPGSQNDSTPEPSQGEDGILSFERGDESRHPNYGANQTLQTTERWYEETEPEELGSRPGTSGSTMTGTSTDDTRIQPLRVSTRNRKRQNTSDFEDALPYSKRIGKKVTASQTNCYSEVATAEPQNDGNLIERGSNTRRARIEETKQLIPLGTAEGPTAESITKSQNMKDGQSTSVAKDDGTRRKKQSENSKKKLEGLEATNLRAVGDVPTTLPEHSNSTNGVATESLPGSKTKDIKEGPQPSRASMNMRRRWAAKKQAEALGLPVPKIGRYPKGGSIPPTSDVVGTPEVTTSTKIAGGRKRKREEDEQSIADTGDAGMSDAGVVTKSRGGRLKKTTTTELATTASAVYQDVNHYGDLIAIPPSDNQKIPTEEPVPAETPKRKGGRPRKKVAEAQPSLAGNDGVIDDFQAGVAAESLPIVVKSKSGRPRKGAANTQVLPDNTQSTNEEETAEEKKEEELHQPLKPRTSGRTRRQTSAALSSQAGTRPSSRSSQKATITPTPAPVQQTTEEPMIKQEPGVVAALPKKRGRKPKGSAGEAISEPAVMSADDPKEIEEPPAKRRRVVRSKDSESLRNTPAPLLVSEDVNTVAPPSVTENAQGLPLEVSSPKKRGGPRFKSIAAAIAPAVDIVSDVQSTREASLTKKGPGRPRKIATDEHIASLIVDTGDGIDEAPSKISRVLSDETVNRATSADIESGVTRPFIPEEPKRKGQWAGKRVGGLSVSTAGPASMTPPRVMSATDIQDGEGYAQTKAFNTADPAASQAIRKSSLIGTRAKKVPPVTTHLMTDIERLDMEAAGSLHDSTDIYSAVDSLSKAVRRKTGGRSGRRAKKKGIANEPMSGLDGSWDEEDVEEDFGVHTPKVESDGEDFGTTVASEAAALEKRKEAAKAAKSEKMSRSMKNRWASGQMNAVMAKKKADNLARKAAAARAAEDTALAGPASAPIKRKAAPLNITVPPYKRRRTMNATMDGAADDVDYTIDVASSSRSPSTGGRKMSEYEHFQQLASPLRSAHVKRQRRPAALRASQSFSKFTDDGDEEEIEENDEEDVETEIKKQFDSEYDHFKALASPVNIPGVILGKRKRKPVINLEEAMRIEAGDDDDFED